MLYDSARLNYFCKYSPKCPSCGNEGQQQILVWLKAPAKWKCRMCKTEHTWEPTGAPPNEL